MGTRNLVVAASSLIKQVTIGLCSGLLFVKYVVAHTIVQGRSMQPTLQPNDHLIAHYWARFIPMG
jgi:signal peptidase I